jgi:hypothetical protein
MLHRQTARKMVTLIHQRRGDDGVQCVLTPHISTLKMKQLTAVKCWYLPTIVNGATIQKTKICTDVYIRSINTNDYS